MSLQSTDPEYTQRLGAFLEEVRNEPDSMLEPTTRWLAILATLTGNGSVDAYKEALPQALQEGLDPVAVKEMVYQATDYLGYGRALPFLHATNDALTAAGIALPLPGQATTTMNDRLEKGIAAQVKIFGEHMNEAWKAGTVNRYLAANCFGDYYTRTGLDLAPTIRWLVRRWPTQLPWPVWHLPTRSWVCATLWRISWARSTTCPTAWQTR